MTESLESVLLLAAGRRNSLRIVPVKIVTVSPLTVQLVSLDGATIPAVPIRGLTYTAGLGGLAFLAEGITPPVLPV